MSEQNRKRVSPASRKHKMQEKLAQPSRVERLRAIIEMAREKREVTAFDLAVQFNVSPNVIYRDIKELRDAKQVPSDWQLVKKARLSAMELL